MSVKHTLEIEAKVVEAGGGKMGDSLGVVIIWAKSVGRFCKSSRGRFTKSPYMAETMTIPDSFNDDVTHGEPELFVCRFRGTITFTYLMEVYDE